MMSHKLSVWPNAQLAFGAAMLFANFAIVIVRVALVLLSIIAYPAIQTSTLMITNAFICAV